MNRTTQHTTLVTCDGAQCPLRAGPRHRAPVAAVLQAGRRRRGHPRAGGRGLARRGRHAVEAVHCEGGVRCRAVNEISRSFSAWRRPLLGIYLDTVLTGRLNVVGRREIGTFGHKIHNL